MTPTTITDGWSHEQLIVSDLTRQQIAQYAGASGDFARIHLDEPYAVDVFKSPAVVAHGMLTMGLTGRVLTDLFGPTSLTEFGGRFLNEVRPGDSLITVLQYEGVQDPGSVQLIVTTVREENRQDEVFRGHAQVTMPDSAAE